MRIIAVSLALCVVLGVSGCGVDVASSPAPHETSAELPAPARSLEEIIDTTWLGIDSNDDEIRITFSANHVPAVTTNGINFNSDANAWSVLGQTLSIVQLGRAKEGTYSYTGEFDLCEGRIEGFLAVCW